MRIYSYPEYHMHVKEEMKYVCVGAFHGNLPHVANIGNRRATVLLEVNLLTEASSTYYIYLLPTAIGPMPSDIVT
jgi:hypothetical protein